MSAGDPTAGEVLVDGIPLTDVNLHSWRQHVCPGSTFCLGVCVCVRGARAGGGCGAASMWGCPSQVVCARECVCEPK